MQKHDVAIEISALDPAQPQVTTGHRRYRFLKRPCDLDTPHHRAS